MGYLKYVLLLVLIFFLAGCPPYLVKILTPSDGAEFEVCDEIEFTGLARDLIDGKLEGDSLVWTSSIDDKIGTGTNFTRDYFSVGTHTITLTATNSSSEKWTDSVIVTIKADNCVMILTPSDGAEFEVGDVIVFTGWARDLIDGRLEGDSLVWTSSIDDEIGTGTNFTRDYFSVGTHTITLTATNSSSEKWTDSVIVTITEYHCFSNGAICISGPGSDCCSRCCCYDTEIMGECMDPSDCWFGKCG